MADVSPTVTDVPARRRYEARDAGAEGTVAGFAEYLLAGEMVVFTHTEVDPSYEGRGIGSALVRASLDDVRSRGMVVLPLCPFYKGWIQRHPEYEDLVYRRPPSSVTD
ncbi:GNAT family N-acetyltransferase [Nocardiopsis suaedae]|uniref:GNAT family N-acetyltransferase n=1 Tax=Nocardiopsis suaedae TaxID=3018444 RepID=A0ABT4TFJ2_9ACTN|nr:GNAT family N-acetyltransferase [Nocardiopsis suaedae]MDA2803485.1 GNAT family N-acetyltransferase [Nocardiopsis suaedae]